MKTKTATVFCASSSRVPQIYLDTAYRLGELLADAGITLLTGGGSDGLMRRVQDGALDAGGHVEAIIPQFMIDAGWLHEGVKKIQITETMSERKELLISQADVLLVLPGGCGTLDELGDALVARQLGLSSKDIIILNTEGFYDPLLEQFERYAAQGFMRNDDLKLWRVAKTAEELVSLLD